MNPARRASHVNQRQGALDADSLLRENEHLRREMETLREEMADKDKQIADLERQLAASQQNSRNSSKPPSSDGLAGAARERGRGPAAGRRNCRKRGGQPGHPGHHRPNEFSSLQGTAQNLEIYRATGLRSTISNISNVNGALNRTP